MPAPLAFTVHGEAENRQNCFPPSEVSKKLARRPFLLCHPRLQARNAQPSLQDQINAVNEAQNVRKAEEAAREAERLRQIQIRKAKEQADAERRHAEKIANQRTAEARAHEARAKAQAAAAAKDQERLKDKARDQQFEDELRQLELEKRRLELEARRAKVKRTDDYIDAELSRARAGTDVVQSRADAKRNESEGAKEMMRGIDKGAESKDWNPFK